MEEAWKRICERIFFKSGHPLEARFMGIMKKGPFTKHSDKTFLFAIVACALLVRLFSLWFFGAYNINPGESPFAGWSFGYETGRIAKSLATGHGFSFH